MPMDGISQPKIIDVNETLRLRKYDGIHGFAFEWYQDTETVYLVDGVREPYSHETLDAMYHYLDQRGEMYFIEQRRGDVFVPIGDVCFSDQDMPIVIGDRTCRGQGIGRQVVSALIARGKNVDWKVVPKVVFDLNDLKNDIIKAVTGLQNRYQDYIAASDNVDYEGRAVEIINSLKDKASKAVYKVTPAMAKEKAIKLMEEVGIAEPRMRYYQYPFEFSGGMRQRIVIAIALSADPEILICDEPTTALDVTIQAQILELINRLKAERNLSVIFITHDLGVVANMADDIAVMYAGKIVEYGTADDIFYDPRHPYTWALLSSMPDLDTKEKLDAIPGTPPNMIYPPVGDAFAARNKYAMQIDFEAQPPMFEISETHRAATWLLHPEAPAVEIPKIITDRIARMKQKAGGAQNG